MSTPAWQVDWTLAAGFAKIEQQFGAIREILDDPDLYNLRDAAVSGWRCGEQAGHLAMVTRWIAMGIEANLADPTRDSDGKLGDVTAPVLQAGAFPRGAATAPPEVDPTRRPRDDILPILPAAVSAWQSLRAKTADLSDCPARFPHFALGYLTIAEWVVFCAIHTAHHLEIVRDIRVAAS